MITRVVLLLSAWMVAGPACADRLLLQVEDFEGPWRRQTNVGGFLGQGFCTSSAKGRIATTAMRGKALIREPGRYAVWLRAYTSDNSRRGLQMEVAGKRLGVTHKDTRNRWGWEKAGELDLAAGAVEIVVHDADVGFESADAVLLTSDLGEDPMADERRWCLYPDKLPDRANALRFNIDACVSLARQRQVPQGAHAWQLRRVEVAEQLRRALAFEPWPAKTPLQPAITGRCDRGRYTIENLRFQSRPHCYVTANVYVPKEGKRPWPAIVVTAGHAMQDRLDVAALMIRPSASAAPLPAVVWLDADGKRSVCGSKLADMVLSRGVALLAVDVRGVGEAVVPENQCASDAIALGRPMLAQQTWDVICAARYLAGHKDIDSRRIAVYGRGWTGILAATAAAMEESISAVVTEGAFASYLHTIAAPLPQPRWVYATNLLRAADVPDLLALCSPRPVLWVNPTGGDGHRPPEERLRALLDRVDAAASVIPCLADAPEERVAEFIQGQRPSGPK